MSLRFMPRKRKLRGVPCYRPILRDPTVSDGALRLLLIMKASAEHGQVTIDHGSLAEELKVSRATIVRRAAELERKRLVKTVPNSSRGLKQENTYLLEDEFYAKHLAKKKKAPRCSKIATGVPSVLSNIPACTLREDPPNVIPMQERPPKPIRYA